MNIEKKRRFIINFVFYVILLGIAVLTFTYVIPILAPFVIGLAIALFLKPLILFITRKTGFDRKVVSGLVLLFFYLIAFALLTYAGAAVVIEGRAFAFRLPAFYRDNVELALNNIFSYFIRTFPDLEGFIIQSVENITASLGAFVQTLSENALRSISSLATTVSVFFIKTLFMFISSFFFVFDGDKIIAFLMRQLTDNGRRIVSHAKMNAKKILVNYTKAYLILISITFLELSVGLSLLRVHNAILFALLISFFDILPVLGAGGILIPWAVISLALGNFGFGIGLLVLYLIITVVRQSLEPNIIGDQIGLHPIVILFCVFLGGRFFGLLGIFILPITVTIIKRLNDDKIIALLK